MAINIKNYIEQKLSEIGAKVDTRPGSVWSDLIGNPLIKFFETFDTFQDDVAKNQSLSDVATMSESTLDNIGANFLVNRITGTKATGVIKLYFSSPQAIVVPKGTIFSTSDGLEYSTVVSYTISKAAMNSNRDDYPLYNTADIQVESVGQGAEYNRNPGEISKNVTFAGTPAKISNLNPITGGTVVETNEQYYERIKENITGPNVSSASGLKKLISNNFPNYTSIKIIGAGSPFMQRDLSLLSSAVAEYKEEDFFLVYSGQSNPLAKKHKAYWGNFLDLDETSSIKKPSPNQFNSEFSDTMYEGLFYKDDLLVSETGYQSIIQEFFDSPNINGQVVAKPLEAVLSSGAWQIHDGKNPAIGDDGKRGLPFNEEFGTEDGYIRLGKKYDISDPNFNVQIPYTSLLGLQTLLTTATTTNLPIDENVTVEYETTDPS